MRKKTSYGPLAFYLIAVALALAGFVSVVWFAKPKAVESCLIMPAQP